MSDFWWTAFKVLVFGGAAILFVLAIIGYECKREVDEVDGE